MSRQSPPKKVRTLRCAVYTRKSTDEGLDREFTSLDAQREAGEAYIASQKDQGWILLTEKYDDGGYSGGSLERPALQRLISAVEAGRIDCVLVYKVDRLSRSLLDFSRLMALFERHQVSFVSVTQHFNTSTSMGRLILNVLLSFAQFERELISERTRDKMGAARRKGKWLGSAPVLGYDADREKRKLVANAAEAQRVQDIFQLYLQFGSLDAAARELSYRRWLNKQWTTQQGHVRGGRPFTKASLQYLLTNVTYIGQVKYKGEIYAGEQPGLVSRRLFRQVQRLLKQNRRSRPHSGRSPLRGLLEGLLHCAACEMPLRHTYSAKGHLRYRYYVCRQNGHAPCPAGWIPAPKIEQQVLEELESHLFQENGLQTWPAGDYQKQADLLRQLVARIQYDAAETELAIHLHKEALGPYLRSYQAEPLA